MEIGKDVLIDMGFEVTNDERVLAGDYFSEVGLDTVRVIAIEDRVFSTRKGVLYLKDTACLTQIPQSKHFTK